MTHFYPTRRSSDRVGIDWNSTYPLTDPVTGVTTEIEYGKMPCRPVSGRGAGPCNPFVPAEIRADAPTSGAGIRSAEHTSVIQSLMRISYAVYCLKKKKQHKTQ